MQSTKKEVTCVQGDDDEFWNGVCDLIIHHVTSEAGSEYKAPCTVSIVHRGWKWSVAAADLTILAKKPAITLTFYGYNAQGLVVRSGTFQESATNFCTDGRATTTEELIAAIAADKKALLFTMAKLKPMFYAETEKFK